MLTRMITLRDRPVLPPFFVFQAFLLSTSTFTLLFHLNLFVVPHPYHHFFVYTKPALCFRPIPSHAFCPIACSFSRSRISSALRLCVSNTNSISLQQAQDSSGFFVFVEKELHFYLTRTVGYMFRYNDFITNYKILLLSFSNYCS